MVIQIDFQSDEAIYMQLRNQIILSIAASTLREGDSLPSVRQLAEEIQYTAKKPPGFVTIDRRRGAVVALDHDRERALSQIRESLRVELARAHCRQISREDLYALIDEIYEEYESAGEND